MKHNDIHNSDYSENTDQKNDKGEELNRRQFIQVGTAFGTTGIALGLSTLSEKKREIFTKIARASSVKEKDEFPVTITDTCKQMNQKYTIFSRMLWDEELFLKMKERGKVSDRESMENERGWTPLDRALSAAGWAIDHRFSTESENGQPNSPTYEWEGPVNRKRVKFKNSEDASQKVKKAARFLGASLVGIANYDSLWTYNPLLRQKLEMEGFREGPPEFDLIPPDFPFEPKSVVVIAIEMDYKAIALSPSSIQGASTGLGYSRMSAVGLSVVTFIRELGYKAFACGNDVSLSVPYAIAAGLGELGRNGLLITRDFGPRVRLVKVFTELEIKPDRPIHFGAWEFCKNCKRCAESCPSKAIPFDDEPTLEGKTISNNPGVLKWYIDPEKCIQFWEENESCCANCITSCPFNKSAMWHHQLITGITALPFAPFHSVMAKIDKVFGYGNIYDMKGNGSFWEED